MSREARLVSLDHLRAFITALVVLHHSVLAYCYFGHLDKSNYLASTAPVIDAQRFIGFDVLALMNDSFFMPLMFLLSGLFVWPSLMRKGIGPYLRDRMLRLGLPLAVTLVFCTPLAYYPSWRETGGGPGLARFWIMMVGKGPWPSGPPWFVAVLLLFDAVTVRILAGFGQRLTGWRPRLMSDAVVCFAGVLALSLLSYLPLLEAFGPLRWLSLGPFSVQASRIGLYFTYFAAGVAFGLYRLLNSGSSFQQSMIRSCPIWTFVMLIAAFPLIITARPGWYIQTVHGVTLVVFCAATCFALMALSFRFSSAPSRVIDDLAECSYGIYLVHFPLVTWTQYALLSATLSAAAKATVTFGVSLGVSWALTWRVRQVPSIRRVI